MKKNSIFICSFFLLSILSIPSNAQNEAWRKYNGALLWKISGKETKSASYLLGSHHLMPTEFAKTIHGLETVLNEVEQVVGELDLKEIATIGEQINSAAKMPSDQAYETLLSKGDYARLDEALKSILGESLEDLKLMKPAILSQLVSLNIYSKNNPTFNYAQERMDIYVQRILAEKGKQTVGLETVEEQLEAVFDAIPLKEQVETLLCEVSNIKQLGTLSTLLSENYIKGNLVKIYDLSFNNKEIPCEVSEAVKKVVLKKRNDNWLAKIPEIIKEKASLITIGALHLTGEEGLLFQLSKQGYTIEAVK